MQRVLKKVRRKVVGYLPKGTAIRFYDRALVNQLLNDGLYNEALEIVLPICREQIPDVHPYQFAGSAFAGLGNLDRALNYFKKAAEFDPKLVQGDILELSSKMVIRLKGSSDESQRARLCADLFSTLRDLIADSYQDDPALLLSVIELILNTEDATHGFVFPVTPAKEAAGDLIVLGKELYPDHLDFSFEYGKHLWRSGQREEALAYLGSLSEQCPNHVGLLALRADFHNQNRDWEEAYKLACEAYDLAPDLLGCGLQKARALIGQNRELEALPILEELAAVYPDDPSLVQTYATLELALGFCRRARERVSNSSYRGGWAEEFLATTSCYEGIDTVSLDEDSVVAKGAVLVAVGAGLGNILQTTPLLRRLSEFRGHPIDVVITTPTKGGATLLAGAPWIGEVFEDPAKVSDRYYDYVLVTGCCGTIIPPLAGKNKFIQLNSYGFMDECKFRHEVEYNFLGVDTLFPGFTAKESDYDRYFVADQQWQGAESKRIAINDSNKSGLWARRKWPHIKELVTALQNQGYEVASFGVPGEFVEGTVDMTGLSLSNSIEELSKCTAFIGCDGGLFHIAEALDMPTVVLFGPTSILKNGPRKENVALVFNNKACSPCQWKYDFHFCDDPICMTTISVEEVLRAFDLVFGNAPKKTLSIVADAIQHELDTRDTPYRPELVSQYVAESIGIYPEDHDFYTLAANACISHGRFSRAKQILKTALRKFPEEESFLHQMLRVFFLEEEFTSACEFYRSWIQSINFDTSSFILYLDALARLERWEELLSAEPALDNFTDFESSQIKWLRGVAACELEEWEDAQQRFKESLKLAPGVSHVESAVEALDDTELKAFIEQLNETELEGERSRVVLFAHHHLARWEPHGGELSSREIVHYLQNQGLSVLVVVANSKTDDVFCERHEGIDYVVANHRFFKKTVASVLESYRPKLSLMWGPHSITTGPLCARHGVPYILFVRYWKEVCQPPYLERQLDRNFAPEDLDNFREMYAKASEVIVNAGYVNQVVKRLYDVDGTVAYVPVEELPSDAPLSAKARTKITLINPLKAGGQDLLLRLASRHPDLEFLTIGEPSENLPSNVEIRPYSSDPYWSYLADTRVLLFPFDEDPCGTGRVVFEAYNCGIPVISVNKGGIGEVVGEEWLVGDVSSEDDEKWSELIRRIHFMNNEEYGKHSAYLQDRMKSFSKQESLAIVGRSVRRSLGVVDSSDEKMVI